MYVHRIAVSGGRRTEFCPSIRSNWITRPVGRTTRTPKCLKNDFFQFKTKCLHQNNQIFKISFFVFSKKSPKIDEECWKMLMKTNNFNLKLLKCWYFLENNEINQFCQHSDSTEWANSTGSTGNLLVHVRPCETTDRRRDRLETYFIFFYRMWSIGLNAK